MKWFDRVKRNFNKNNVFVQTVILLLMVALIGGLLVSFTDIIPFAVTNIEGKSTFVAGESQSFQITLKTVDPEQFTTENHFREQYGRWRIEDYSGNVISGGRLTKLSGGLYDQLITVQIPEEGGTLISEIIEYQFSSLDGVNFIQDDGTIRESSEIPLDLTTCSVDTDCSNANICSTKTVSCTGGVCISSGECSECTRDSQCFEGEECIQDSCFKIPEKTPLVEFRETISKPITETGAEVDGEPAPKTAPLYLIWMMLGMWGVLGFLYFQLKKKKKSIIPRKRGR